MSLTLTLTDTTDTITYDLLQVPFTTGDIVGNTDVTVLSGDVYTDYIYAKRQWKHKWSFMDITEYKKLRGFYDRQFSTAKYPVMTLVEPDGTTITTPVRMDINDKKITSQCGMIEDVEITLRETSQQ